MKFKFEKMEYMDNMESYEHIDHNSEYLKSWEYVEEMLNMFKTVEFYTPKRLAIKSVEVRNSFYKAFFLGELLWEVIWVIIVENLGSIFIYNI